MGDLGLFGPGAPLRFSDRRSRSMVSDSIGAVRYPSPFFDLGSMYLPSSFKTMLKWCRYYFLTNPTINAVVYKMAAYPVTDLIIDEENEKLRDQWSYFFSDVLQFKRFLVEVGLDYNAYGNAFISIYFPFKKFLICPRCGHYEKASDVSYSFRDFKFRGECRKCHQSVDFKAKDHYVPSYREIRMIRWNPEFVSVLHNDATGESRYYFRVPGILANDIRLGKRHVVENVPQMFIDAVAKELTLLFSPSNLYHMKRPTLADKDKGWGLPMILPVLKDVYYLQILRKAQECLAPSTLVETYKGLIPASEVAVGDLVRTHTGKFQPVESKWERVAHEDEVGVKLTVSALRSLSSVYSPHHPILTIRRTDKHRRSDTKDHQRSSVILRNPHLYEEFVCPADQMKVGDYVLYPTELPCSLQTLDIGALTGLTHTDNFVYLGVSEPSARAYEALELGKHVEHDNPGRVAKRKLRQGKELRRITRTLLVEENLAYILGWYVGDGSCGSRHVEFSLGADDNAAPLIEAIHNVFGIKCSQSPKKDSQAVSVTASSVVIRNLLKAIVPGVARTKRVPECIFNSPKSIKLAFLKGLWEADGNLGRNYASVATASRDLAYDVFKLLAHLGCIPNVEPTKPARSVLKNGRVINGGGGFRVGVLSRSAKRLIDLWSGKARSATIVSGKSGFFWKGYLALRISNTDEQQESKYIDFKVAVDTTFCTPGTATKNSIAVEHAVPLRILFPQAASASSDPYTTINLTSWKGKIEQEIMRWRLDNNYIPILPLPVGQETLGGDGKALMLSQEYKMWQEAIITGMGVPLEFVMGGLSYTGSSVSLRMLENHFLDQKSDHMQLVKFVMEKVGAFMGWPRAKARFKRFKMADDLQRSAFNLQLNQAGKISNQSLLEESDWDSSQESERIALESKRALEGQRQQALGQANVQGEAQLVMQKYQMKGQKIMQQSGQQMDPMMMQQQQQMQQQMQGVTGVPGQMSPDAAGQMQVTQQGMMSQAGQIPPLMPPEQVNQEAQMQQAQMQSAQAQPPQAAPQMPAAPAAPPVMQSMQSPLQPTPQQQQVSLFDLVNGLVAKLDQLPQHEQQAALTQLSTFSPSIFHLVQGTLQSRSGSHGNSAGMPQPTQRPPRRGPEAQTL